MPYWRVLKAYAYAGKSFEYALQKLSKMRFETPKPDKENHLPYLRKYRAVFNGFRTQALRKSKTFQYTPAEIEELGVDPFYTWILEGEKGTPNDKAAFVQGVIDDLDDVHLRKLVSIGIYLGQTSREIQDHLRRHSPVAWKAYHIDFYRRFFWSVEEMSAEARKAYLAITCGECLLGGYDHFEDPSLDRWMRSLRKARVEMPNEHFAYLSKVLTPGNERLLRLESLFHFGLTGYPTTEEVTNSIQDQLLFAVISRNTSQIDRFGSMYLKLCKCSMAGFPTTPEFILVEKAIELIRQYGLPLTETDRPGWYTERYPEQQIVIGILGLQSDLVDGCFAGSRTLILGAKLIFLYKARQKADAIQEARDWRRRVSSASKDSSILFDKEDIDNIVVIGNRVCDRRRLSAQDELQLQLIEKKLQQQKD